jgi:hypothetical protein
MLLPDAFGGRTLVRAGLQSRSGSEAKASRGLKPALQAAQNQRFEARAMLKTGEI